MRPRREYGCGQQYGPDATFFLSAAFAFSAILSAFADHMWNTGRATAVSPHQFLDQHHPACRALACTHVSRLHLLPWTARGEYSTSMHCHDTTQASTFCILGHDRPREIRTVWTACALTGMIQWHSSCDTSFRSSWAPLRVPLSGRRLGLVTRLNKVALYFPTMATAAHKNVTTDSNNMQYEQQLAPLHRQRQLV